MSDLILENKQKINQVCEEYGITSLSIFGSQVRGEARDDSDVDLLVEFRETPGLIEFIQAKHKFEMVFNRKVDLITKNALSKYLFPYVSQDIQQIYG